MQDENGNIKEQTLVDTEELRSARKKAYISLIFCFANVICFFLCIHSFLTGHGDLEWALIMSLHAASFVLNLNNFLDEI